MSIISLKNTVKKENIYTKIFFFERYILNILNHGKSVYIYLSILLFKGFLLFGPDFFLF